MNVYSIQISRFVYILLLELGTLFPPLFALPKMIKIRLFGGDFPTLCYSPVLFVLNGKDRKKCETKQKLLLKPHSLG